MSGIKRVYRVQAEEAAGLDALLARCPPGAVVELGPGDYRVALDVRRTITLRGVGGAEHTVLVGRAGAPLLRAGGEALVLRLEGLTVRGGRARSGAGVHLSGAASLIARACVFVDNRADALGGAILVSGGRARVDRCDFESNRAALGGALCLTHGARAQVSRCRFDANRARAGAACAVMGASEVELRECRLVAPASSAGGPESVRTPPVFGMASRRHRPLISLVGCDVPEDEPHLRALGCAPRRPAALVVAERPGTPPATPAPLWICDDAARRA